MIDEKENDEFFKQLDEEDKLESANAALGYNSVPCLLSQKASMIDLVDDADKQQVDQTMKEDEE